MEGCSSSSPAPPPAVPPLPNLTARFPEILHARPPFVTRRRRCRALLPRCRNCRRPRSLDGFEGSSAGSSAGQGIRVTLRYHRSPLHVDARVYDAVAYESLSASEVLAAIYIQGYAFVSTSETLSCTSTPMEGAEWEILKKSVGLARYHRSALILKLHCLAKLNLLSLRAPCTAP